MNNIQDLSKKKHGGKRKNAGKKKGSKNLKTIEWEQFGRTVIDGNLQQVQDYMNSLDGKNNFEAWLKLIEYFKPKLTRSDVNQNNSGSLIIIQKTISDARANNKN